MKPFIIPSNKQPKTKKKQLHMSMVLCNYNQMYYEAIITLGKKRNQFTKDIIGHRILATDGEALKAMLLELTEIYPPETDIEVIPQYVESVIQPKL